MRNCRSDRPPGRAVWHHTQRTPPIRAGDVVVMPGLNGAGAWLLIRTFSGRLEIRPFDKKRLEEAQEHE